MDRIAVARELLAIARELEAMEFPTQDAYDKYMREHPDADKSLHRVVETKEGPAKGEAKPESKTEGDDFLFKLSGKMSKAKGLIEKVYRKAMSSQNVKAVSAIEQTQEPFFKLVRDSGWSWTKYSDPWKDVSEQDRKKLISMAEKTLKAVKEIAKAHGLT